MNNRLKIKHNGVIYRLKIHYTENRASRGHHGKKFKRTIRNLHFGIYKTNKSHETSKDFTENNELEVKLGSIIDVIEMASKHGKIEGKKNE